MTAPNYDIDPALIAHADRHFAIARDNLTTCIESYRYHVGRTDPTVALVVLADNIGLVIPPGDLADALAAAIQMLADLTPAPASPPPGGPAPRPTA